MQGTNKTKRGYDPKKDAVLCDKDGELTPRFIEVLKEIFATFDSDKDGALNVTELNNYAKFCNGKPFPDKEITDIQENLQCNDAGALLPAGFLQLYSLQTQSDPQETWRDVLKNGYDLQLKKRPAALPATSS